MAVVAELTALDETIDRGAQRLLDLQRPGGMWCGELESNVTMTAQHLFWNHALGLRTPDLDRRIANELMARMRDDGTWSIWYEGPPDLSTSIEAYVALRMAGVDPGPKALAYIRREGGVPKSRLFTKCFLALLGQWPWQRMVPIPPELVLLPPSSPFSIYNFACWARQTFVALSVAQSLRPVRPIDVDLSAIGAMPGRTRPAPPPGPLRRRALRVAEQWIRERQEADGSWGGIQPPWVWGIVALAALGHGLDDPTLGRAVAGWQSFLVEDGDRLRPEACQSPVWDTGLAVLALRACGVSADHPQLRAAGEYILSQEVTVKGDWAIRVPGLAPGAWAFEYENDLYPDTDDAAVISFALRQLDTGDGAVRRALDWLVGMQSRDGGWGAFDVDNQAMWLYKIPFCDFGKVTDEPSADVTAHALETLGHEDGYDDAVERGLAWLLAEQEADGSWFGRWGVNHLYGTGAALPALEACGVPSDHPSMRRAVAWLDSVQQAHGGFGEDIRSYADASWRGRATFATPSQTAWALLAYVAAGNAEDENARRAGDYLCAQQRSDGDWDELHFTGTGFPLDFMIRYHLYRISFPLLALGRMRERLSR
ncbi:MAG TPA: squalene--hopene cyclase [Gaiellaceae bacterium]|jgi:squalene-hopene/tetraprenyl-beta-curcumene cyclase|nr:squalene--hopene cyclase [Gaiellaceae bacterium]